MGALRVNRSLLRQQEAVAVGYFLDRLPSWCAPDHLTALSLVGAVTAGVSLICCRLSGWFVIGVAAGLFCNWFGDSLDGALARLHKIERPRIGYLLDRGVDIVSMTAIILGLGLSPYMSVFAATMLLLVYYAHTIYSLLRNVIDGIHVIGLVGIGATEGRILVGAWAVFAQLVGPDVALARSGNVLLLDVFYGGLFAVAIGTFIVRLLSDLRRLEGAEARRVIRAAENVVPLVRNETARPRPPANVLSERKGFAPVSSGNKGVPI